MAMTGNCWKTHGLATHAAQLAAKYSLSCVQCTINNAYKFAQMQKCTFQRKEIQGANCKDWGKTVARQVRSCNWAKESHQDQNAFAAQKYLRRNIVRWHRENLLSKLFFELEATAVCSIFVCLCFCVSAYFNWAEQTLVCTHRHCGLPDMDWCWVNSIWKMKYGFYDTFICFGKPEQRNINLDSIQMNFLFDIKQGQGHSIYCEWRQQLDWWTENGSK